MGQFFLLIIAATSYATGAVSYREKIGFGMCDVSYLV